MKYTIKDVYLILLFRTFHNNPTH